MRLVTNLDPFGRGDRLGNPLLIGLGRRIEWTRLTEQPIRVERRQQLGVLEALAARLIGCDWLEQRLLTLPSGTHTRTSPPGPVSALRVAARGRRNSPK